MMLYVKLRTSGTVFDGEAAHAREANHDSEVAHFSTAPFFPSFLPLFFTSSCSFFSVLVAREQISRN